MKGALIFLVVVFMMPRQAFSENLIYNGDFERSSYKRESLADGVDNAGRLRVAGRSAPFVTDIDGDGKKDIICGDALETGSITQSSGMIWGYLNSGTSQAPEFTSARFVKQRFDMYVKPAVIDWDGDGREDIIFGSANGWVQFLKRKSRELEFDDPRFVNAGSEKLDIGQYSSPAVFDWNGDGKKDLILGEGTYSANSVYIYLNSGSRSHPSFEKDSRLYLAYGEGKMNLTPSIVDWDKDGDPDLICGDKYGYINLYINETGSGGRKVEILKFSGRLKDASGKDIDVGSMSHPSATDWDEDGDWDIVCGSSQGLIYLILNEGSIKEPRFSAAQALKGENTITTDTAYGWNMDNYREGLYDITLDDTQPNSGKSCLKLVCYERYGGKVNITGNIRSMLERDTKYEFSFFVKGEDMKGEWVISYGGVSERAVVGGVRTHKELEPGWSESEKFNLTGSWRKVTKRFSLPRIKDKELREKLGERKSCSLTITFEGSGTAWIDDVSLEMAGK